MAKRKLKGARCHMCEKIKLLKTGRFVTGIYLRLNVPFLCITCEREIEREELLSSSNNKSKRT